ncbi:MAG: peptidase M23, partial [Ferruginibacter sp.]|nr:peptidase M23 [Ferruginibacter sp.]
MSRQLLFNLQKYQPTYHPVIKIDPEKDKIISFNFTATNTEITTELITDTQQFSAWVNNKLHTEKATFGIGGYNENRTLYSRSNLFAG